MIDITKFPLISDQIDYKELRVILRELEKALVATQSGAAIELGCYTGTTSLFIRRVLDANDTDREFHVYDSFSGLPTKLPQDSSPAGMQFVAGELKASKQQLITHFKQAGLRVPAVHKVWFEELTPEDLPQQIAFAFLDGDFYSSIKSSLAVITPKLVPGAIIIVDDYQSESLPGARKAVDEWAQAHQRQTSPEQSLAIIHW